MIEPERFPEGWDPQVDGGYIVGRPMDDGRWWCLLELYGGRVRIVIAEDEFSAGEHWCYSNPALGMAYWVVGPERTPEGWTRHMLPSGAFERRAEDGTPYVSEMD